jgi:hypothetical protein
VPLLVMLTWAQQRPLPSPCQAHFHPLTAAAPAVYAAPATAAATAAPGYPAHPAAVLLNCLTLQQCKGPPPVGVAG